MQIVRFSFFLLLYTLLWPGVTFAEQAEPHTTIDRFLESTVFPPTQNQLAPLSTALAKADAEVQLRLTALHIVSSEHSFTEKQQQLSALLTTLSKQDNLASYLDILLLQAELVYMQQNVTDITRLTEEFSELVAKSEALILPRQRFAVFNLIGRMHQVLGNYELALAFLTKAGNEVVDPASGEGRLRRQFVRMHMARVLLKQQSYTLAEQMLTDTIEQAKTYRLAVLLPELHLLLGYALQVQYGPTEQGLAAFQEATKTVSGSQPGRVQMLALNNLGSVHFYREDYPKAEQYFLKGLTIAEAIESRFEQYVMLFNLGYIQVKTGDVTSGLAQMETAYAIFSQLAALPDQISMLTYLAEAYQAVADTANEAKVLRAILEKREQEVKNTRENLIVEFQTQYEAEEQRLKIALLEQEGELNQVKLDKSARDRFWFAILAATLATALIGVLIVLRHVRHLNGLLSEANSKLHSQSLKDPLTNSFNRRALQQYTQHKNDVLLMLDIDYFKQINDQYGHDMGDTILINLTQHLGAILRKEDMLMRWGGEEFLLILRQVAPEQLDALVSKILQHINNNPVADIVVSVSGGLVTITDPRIALETQINQADHLLYQAKAAGRGQIHSEQAKWFKPTSPQ